MIRFFRKLFKRGDFMTRADKAYYKYRAKTIFWSAFCLIIISWVGTNLVLCALTTNVKSGGDIIYKPPQDVVLPIGQELNKAIKKKTYSTADSTIQTITFGRAGEYDSIIAGVTPEIISAQNEIYLYRVSNGRNIYILSANNMIPNANSSYTFYDFRALTQVTFNNFDTSRGNLTNLSNMFYYDIALKTIGCQKAWNTSKVTDMSYLFYFCEKLTSLSSVNISNWATGAVRYMNRMFLACGLTSLNLSTWNTSNVETMEAMFASSKIRTLNFGSEWDTTKVINMTSIFNSCSDLSTITGLEYWNTSKVTKMNFMFFSCGKLVSMTSIAGWNTSAVEDMTDMFGACWELTTLDASGWNTSKVTSMSYMFSGCSKLKTIYAKSTFVTTRVTNSSNMFDDCSSLVGGKGTKCDGVNNIDKTYARIDGGPSSSTPGYFTQK